MVDSIVNSRSARRRVAADLSGVTRRCDLFIQVMIYLSIISFSISTIPNLSPLEEHILDTVETINLAVFSVEYLVRLLVAGQKLKFIFSFYGVIDLLSILPSYLVDANLTSLRVLRVFRVFRMFKLMRYHRAVERFHRAFADIKEELVIYLIGVLIFFFLSSAVIYHCEHDAQPDKFQSVFHSMWWTLITLSTVGYGDVYPVTLLGKVTTGLILLVGLGTVPIPSGLIAAALTKSLRNK